MKKVMFVCKFNRFRSQIGAGFYNKLTITRSAVSAGVIRGNPISRQVRMIARRNGLTLTRPKGLVRNILNAQDEVIIVADDVPPAIFKTLKKAGKNIRVWKIKDVNEKDAAGIERTVNIIKKKVERLVNASYAGRAYA